MNPHHPNLGNPIGAPGTAPGGATQSLHNYSSPNTHTGTNPRLQDLKRIATSSQISTIKDRLNSLKHQTKATPEVLSDNVASSNISQSQESPIPQRSGNRISYRQQLLQAAHSPEHADHHTVSRTALQAKAEQEEMNSHLLSLSHQQISTPLAYSQYQHQPRAEFNPQHMQQEAEELSTERYYMNLMMAGFGALFLYFVGASIMLFVKNVGDQAIVSLPVTPITWQLLFENFPQFLRNAFSNIFGYFIQYAKLFGYFEGWGTITAEPKPRYLMPVDIIIKLTAIVYFHFRWMSWDSKRLLKLGVFNRLYPFGEQSISKTPMELEQEINDDLADEFPAATHGTHSQTATVQPTLYPAEAAFNAQYNHNDPYYDDEDESVELIPFFDGVHKPLEEWYFKHEDKIYGLIRKRILPGTNLILVLYFSTMGVLDLQRPWEIGLYLLGVMSMFWCMQTFLSILDHNQYPPEVDSARGRQ